MEELNERLNSSARALSTLDEILATPFSIIVRDASIQRFEYSFESLWRLLKIYLKQSEGILCSSPKQCFREGFKVGLLSVEQTEICLVMADDRNLTSHTYIESVANSIYQKLPSYVATMKTLLRSIQDRLAS